MCMKRTSKCLIARRDIPVWKVVKSLPNEPMLSPVYNYPVNLMGIRPALNERLNTGYHSYGNKKTARRLLAGFNLDGSYIIRMYIPKGSRYYRGVDENCCKETDGRLSLQSDFLICKEDL